MLKRYCDSSVVSVVFDDKVPPDKDSLKTDSQEYETNLEAENIPGMQLKVSNLATSGC